MSWFMSFFDQLWDALDYALFRDLTPKVWQSTDLNGQTCWHIYDPEIGKTLHLNTDEDLRHWLERLYQN